MLREALMSAIDALVHSFMHKKALKYKDDDAANQDPFGGPILDPFTMLTRQMLDDILR